MSIIGAQIAADTDRRCRQLLGWEEMLRLIAEADGANTVLIIGRERRIAELAQQLADECVAQARVFEDRKPRTATKPYRHVAGVAPKPHRFYVCRRDPPVMIVDQPMLGFASIEEGCAWLDQQSGGRHGLAVVIGELIETGSASPFDRHPIEDAPGSVPLEPPDAE